MRALLLLFALLPGLAAQSLVLLPKQALVPCGQSLQMRIPGQDPKAFRWQADRGKVDESGLFTAPSHYGACHITATDWQDINRTVSVEVRAVEIRLQSSPELTLKPREEGRIQVELAFRGGELDHKLLWTFAPRRSGGEEDGEAPPKPHDGRLDATGWVRAPSEEGVYSVEIVLATDPRIRTGTLVRVLRPRAGRVNPQGEPVTVQVQPGKAELRAGEFQPFSAWIAGEDLQLVTWSLVDGPKEGELDQQGVFRTPRPGTYKVRATSFAYPECWAEAEVTVLSSVKSVKEEEAAKANRLGIAIIPGPQPTYVLLGGWDGERLSGEALLHDSTAGTFQPCGALQTPRARALAVPLSDGTILVVGGIGGKGGNTPLREAERLDPERKVSWRVGTPRWSHIAGLLQPLPGGRALLIGGQEPQGEPCGAEVYDPATATFRTLDERPWPTHSASVRLKDGRVLILGGELNQKPVALLWSFDPGKNTFTPFGKLAQARSRFTATLLWDEKELVAIGGRGAQGVLATAERLDLTTGRSNPAGRMPAPRERHAAILIPTGQVLVFGGGNGGQASQLMEDWNPDSSTFQIRSQMESGVWLPVLFLNLDGGVFVHGHPADHLAKAPLPGLWHLWD